MANLKVYLTAETKRFRKGLAKADKSVAKLSRNMKRYGAIAGAAFVAGAAASVKAYAEQEQVAAKLRQTLKATGHAAGISFRTMEQEAARLQSVTTFGDEAIMQGQNLLATFKNIKGQTFQDATAAILDMSASLGQDLKSSAIQVGKALNDPVAGMTALGRAGITFSKQQKDQIKQAMKANDIGKAQGIIMAELESQFKGVATAMAETPIGQWKQLVNVVGDLGEAFGEVIVLTADMIFGVGDVKKTISSFAETVKTRGPEIAYQIATVFVNLKAGLHAMWIVAKTTFTNVWNAGKVAIHNIKEAFTVGFHNLKEIMGNLWPSIKAFAKAYATLLVANFKNAFNTIGRMGKAAWEAIKRGDFKGIGAAVAKEAGNGLLQLGKDTRRVAAQMGKDLKDAGLELQKARLKDILDPRLYKSVSKELEKAEKKRLKDLAKLDEKLKLQVAKRVKQQTEDSLAGEKPKEETKKQEVKQRVTQVFSDSLLRVGGRIGSAKVQGETEEAKQLKEQVKLQKATVATLKTMRPAFA